MSFIFQCSSSSIVRDLNDFECCSDKRSLKQECNSFELNFFFISSLSACSLWLWHCLDAVCMLSYMYSDQDRCFISFHWSITSIVCAYKRSFSTLIIVLSFFFVSLHSWRSTLSFLIVVFSLQFEYFSNTLVLQFFQFWWWTVSI